MLPIGGIFFAERCICGSGVPGEGIGEGMEFREFKELKEFREFKEFKECKELWNRCRPRPPYIL